VVTTLRITGMSCNNCVRHVDKALRAVPGVQNVQVDLPEGRAAVEHSATTALPALIAAVESAGYEAVTVGP
jgi:copper chaperone CopZ